MENLQQGKQLLDAVSAHVNSMGELAVALFRNKQYSAASRLMQMTTQMLDVQWQIRHVVDSEVKRQNRAQEATALQAQPTTAAPAASEKGVPPATHPG